MINVVAGILTKKDKILIAKRRLNQHLGGSWEFPGGKIEPNESETDALIREFQEELNIEIRVIKKYHQNLHSYPDKNVNILSYLVEHISGDIQLRAHESAAWVTPDELINYDMAPADIPIARLLIKKGSL